MGATPSKDELLYKEALKGNHDAVKALRREGASLEWIDKEGRTPLIVACTCSELLDMAITLLKLGANMKAYKSGAHGGFPLHHAAKRGLDKTVTLLLSHGADLLALNDEGQTPLDMARSRGHVSVVRLLEEKMSVFSGMLRELSGFSVLESFAPRLVTKKVWVVVLQKGSQSNMAPVYELAIYESPKVNLWNGVRASSIHAAGLCNVPQPKVTFPLLMAEMIEPDFGSSDPVLNITDKAHRSKLKFLSENKGDKAQLEKFYQVCKGLCESHVVPARNIGQPTAGSSVLGNLSQIHPVSLSQSPVLQSVPVPTPPRLKMAEVEPSISDEVALALAIDESIRTAAEEGVAGSSTAVQCNDDDSDGMPEQRGHKRCIFDPNGWVGPMAESGPGVLEIEQLASHARGVHPSAPPLPPSGMCYAGFSLNANSTSTSTTDVVRTCVICWDAAVEGACVPCGHLAGCMRCLAEIKSHKWGCPVCRCEIVQVIKVYSV